MSVKMPQGNNGNIAAEWPPAIDMHQRLQSLPPQSRSPHARSARVLDIPFSQKVAAFRLADAVVIAICHARRWRRALRLSLGDLSQNDTTAGASYFRRIFNISSGIATMASIWGGLTRWQVKMKSAPLRHMPQDTIHFIIDT